MRYKLEGDVWKPPRKEDIFELLSIAIHYDGPHISGDITQVPDDIMEEIIPPGGFAEAWGDDDGVNWYNCMEIRAHRGSNIVDVESKLHYKREVYESNSYLLYIIFKVDPAIEQYVAVEFFISNPPLPRSEQERMLYNVHFGMGI